MSLTDLMSGMNLSLYPQIALVIFLIVFFAVGLRVLLMPRREADELARLPIDETDRRNRT